MVRCRVGALFLVVVLSAATPAFGQISANGSIRGHVRDQQNAVLPGVTVMAASPDGPGVYTAGTDAEGFYRLLDLPPGNYTVAAELLGFTKVKRENVAVRAGLNLGLDITMPVGNLTEAVTVRADSPLLESKTATTTVNISGEFQRELPTSPRRNWSDALILTPGVVAADATTGGLTQNYYVHGSSVSSHVFQVDGADLASASSGQAFYIALNPDLIADVQIKTAGVDAASPLGTGAIMNVATKSGTNTVAGAVTIAIQPKQWNDTNVPGGSSPKVRLIQPDLSLGGPIKKDRLWFFGAYRRIEATTGVARTPSQIEVLSQLDPSFKPFDLDNSANLYFFKLTASPSGTHRLSGFYQSDHNRSQAAGVQNTLPTTNQIGGFAVSGRLFSTWRDAITSEVGLSYNNKTFETPSFDESDPFREVFRNVVLSSGRWLGTSLMGNSGARRNSWTHQPSSKGTLSYDLSYFQPRLLGAHEFRAGLFLQPHLRNESIVNFIRGGNSRERLVLRDVSNPSAGFIPFQNTVWPESNVTYRSNGANLAFYAQDVWRAGRLTATLGIRVDRVRYHDDLFDVTTQESTDIGPRLGLNYAITGDGRSIARVTWNRVHDKVAGAAFAGTTSPTQTHHYDLNLDGTFETVDVVAGSASLARNRVFDEDLHQPYVNEFTAGYRQQLAGQISIDANVVRRQTKDRFAMVDVNGIYEDNRFRGYYDESQREIYNATNNIWNWPIYTALELTATKRTSQFEMIGSYTRQWQHLAGTWQPNDPASFIQPGAFAINRGLGIPSGSSLAAATEASSYASYRLDAFISSPWRDHLLRVGATARVRWNVIFAATYTYQSGPWSGPIIKRLSTPDPAFGPATVILSNGSTVPNPLATVLRFEHPTRGEGQFQLRDYHAMNFRITKSVDSGRRRLALMVDFYNITNGDADQGLIAGGNILRDANFGVGTNRQVPRGAQVGARFTF